MGETTSLEGLLTAIKDGAGVRSLAVWDGLPPLPAAARELAVWEADYAGFLDLAANVGVALVYPVGIAFNCEAELLAAVEEEGYRDDLDTDAEAAAGEPSVNSTRWVMARLRERTEEWADRAGELTTVSCVWFRDGVTHSFQRQADWYHAFEDGMQATLADAEAVGDEDRRLRSDEEAARLHRLAGEMAHHFRYAEATSEAKREYMAQQLFPDEDPFECQQIARRAALIYWWEVEPVERVMQAQKVRELYGAGETMTGIAGILKLSREKVRAALAETAEQ